MWRSHVNLQFDNLLCTIYLQFGYLVIWIGTKAIVSEKRGKGTKKNGNVQEKVRKL